MEMAAKVRTELALSGLFRVVSILKENFGDVKTIEKMKPLNDFVDYKIEELIGEAKSDDLVQLKPSLEELQAAALELEDLLDFYEYDQIEKQVNSFSSETVPKEKVLPTHLKNGLGKLLMTVEQVENKRQSITSKIGTSKPQANTITPTMELAAKVGTEMALSGLFRVAGILDENFRDVKTTEEMKPLNDFVNYRFEALIREAKSDDLVQLMPLLDELQAAALELEDQLDLYEYEQIEKQVNSSSSEPIPKEQVLHGLNKLLMVVERVENKRQSITTSNSFIDFLVGETPVARPVIKLAVSDICRVIKKLGSNLGSREYYPQIFGQLKDVVSYHIQELIRNVDSNDLARSTKLVEMLKASSLQLDLLSLFDQDEYPCVQMERCVDYSDSIPKSKPKFKEELGTILHKSPLRIGLEILLKVVEQVEKKNPSITPRPQANIVTPSLRFGVKKWQTSVEQVEKERPFITSRPQANIVTPSLRFGVEKWQAFVEQVEKERPFITSRPQANIVTPSLRFGVEKWLKFVEQVEKEHPFITSTKETTYRHGCSLTSISTAFSPIHGFLSITGLENVECQEDAEEIMRNHKNNLKDLIFEWTDIASNTDKEVSERTDVASSTDTSKKVLERLEPGRNLESLSIIGYSHFKFPNWMEKKNLLPHLQKLTLRSCTSLKIIPFLPPRLQSLEVRNCHELMQLPLANNALCSIYLSDCPKLTSLGNLQRCTSMIFLDIKKCPMLKKEEPTLVEGVVEGDIVNRLPQIKYIETDDLLLVLELVQQQAFDSIKSLTLKECAAIAIPNLEKLSSLRFLNIRDCPELELLPNLEKLSSLEKFWICNCPELELLPNLPVSLQYIDILNCPKLKEKYEEGGPLCNTISHIPDIRIY